MIGGWQIIIVLLVILLLFGARRIPELGKGLGRGIRSFKEGLQVDGPDERSSSTERLGPAVDGDPDAKPDS